MDGNGGSSARIPRTHFDFSSLPFELKQLIVNEVPFRNLFRLRRVNRDLHSLVQPRLYSASSCPSFTLLDTGNGINSIDEVLDGGWDEDDGGVLLPAFFQHIEIRLDEYLNGRESVLDELCGCIGRFSHHPVYRCSFAINIEAGEYGGPGGLMETVINQQYSILDAIRTGMPQLCELRLDITFGQDRRSEIDFSACILDGLSKQLEELVIYPNEKTLPEYLSLIGQMENLMVLTLRMDNWNAHIHVRETDDGALDTHSWPTHLQDIRIVGGSSERYGLTVPFLTSLLSANSQTLYTLELSNTLISTTGLDGRAYIPTPSSEFTNLYRLTFTDISHPAHAANPDLIVFIVSFFARAPISTLEIIANQRGSEGIWLPYTAEGSGGNEQEDVQPLGTSIFKSILLVIRRQSGWLSLKKIALSRRIFEKLGEHRAVLRELQECGVEIEVMDYEWIDKWDFWD